MKLPTFLGIGAPKCGTTWLAECLREHPDVYLPEVKELVYFSSQKKLARGDSWYLSNFDGAKNALAIGEFSVTYLSGGDEVAEKIKALLPHVRLIAVLRDPVERAFSHYRWLVQLGKINSEVSFEDAMELRPEIVSDSLYYKGLSAFLSRYTVDCIQLISYDELNSSPAGVVADAYRFIGVDPSFVPATLKRHVGKTINPRFRRLERMRIDLYRFARRHGMTGLISFVKRSGLSAFYRELNDSREKVGTLDPATDAKVYRRFSADLQALHNATGFDCAPWVRKRQRAV